MKFIALVGFAVVLVALLASSLGASPVTGAAAAPRIVVGAPVATAPAAPTAPSAAPLAAAAAPLPSSAPVTPQTNCQKPTPTGIPNWGSSIFFSDALVTFYVPGSPGLDGSNFQMAPCNNVIPTYTNGFWMNITTNVPLAFANVTIWGSSWPTVGNVAPDIPNFGPEPPVREMPMNLVGPYYHTATFYFNVYRFFWPGSQVYFNVTLGSLGATPPIIRSSTTSSVPENFPGGTNNATWEFYVADPWGAGTLQQNDADFGQVIQVTTTPSALTTPAYEPNVNQTLDVTLTAVNPTGGPVRPIPMAQANFTLSGGRVGEATFSVAFGPQNHTVQHLTVPIGPYPGSHVNFTITAWLPWSLSTNGQVGAIDRIYSPTYQFNWSTAGGWWYPTYGLLGNTQLTSIPDVTTSGTVVTTLATGTAVNLTLHSPIENVTISSARVIYQYSDANGVATGTLTMGQINSNTTYLVLPGLPPGGRLVFSLSAKDVFGDTLSTGNYTYTETGPPTAPTLVAGYGLFFAEGVDLATGQLIPLVNFTIANSTWSESGHGRAFGFLQPIPLGGIGYLPVAYGTYTVTLSAFGATQSYSFKVSNPSPFTVVFYFASKPIQTPTTVNSPSTITIPAIVGLVAAAVTAVPVLKWFRERRRKAEAEQRRISL